MNTIEPTPKGGFIIKDELHQADPDLGGIPVLIDGDQRCIYIEREQLPTKVTLPEGMVVRLEVVAVQGDTPNSLYVRAGYVPVTHHQARELVAQKGAAL